MSSILDALRKLDEQKNARKHGPVDIAAGVVRPSSSFKPIGMRPWQIGATLALVIAVSVLLTMLAMRDKQPALQAVSPSGPSASTMASVPVPVLPPTRVPVTVAPPTPAPRNAVAPLVTAQRPVKTSPSALPTTGLQPAHTPVPHTEALTAETAVPVEPPRPVPSPTVSLKLTGIGWQKDAASRFAVINGTAVGEGGMIDGAKVDEILPEKVRLKVDGKIVEIGLGK